MNIDRNHPLVAAATEEEILVTIRVSRRIGAPIGTVADTGPALLIRNGIPERISAKVLGNAGITTIGNQSIAIHREQAAFLKDADRRQLLEVIAERILLSTENMNSWAWRDAFADRFASETGVSREVGLWAVKAPVTEASWSSGVASRAGYAADIELNGGAGWEISVHDLMEGRQIYTFFTPDEETAIEEGAIAAAEAGCRNIDEINVGRLTPLRTAEEPVMEMAGV